MDLVAPDVSSTFRVSCLKEGLFPPKESELPAVTETCSKATELLSVLAFPNLDVISAESLVGFHFVYTHL